MDWKKKKNLFSRGKKKKERKTSGRATEYGSLCQDGQTCDRCWKCRTEQQNHSLQVALTKHLIQIIIYVKCVDPRGAGHTHPQCLHDSKDGRICEGVRNSGCCLIWQAHPLKRTDPLPLSTLRWAVQQQDKQQQQKSVRSTAVIQIVHWRYSIRAPHSPDPAHTSCNEDYDTSRCVLFSFFKWISTDQ